MEINHRCAGCKAHTTRINGKLATFLYGLYVEPENRGNGDAKLILHKIIKTTKSGKPHQKIYLEAKPYGFPKGLPMLGLMKLYRSFGFRYIKRTCHGNLMKLFDFK